MISLRTRPQKRSWPRSYSKAQCLFFKVKEELLVRTQQKHYRWVALLGNPLEHRDFPGYTMILDVNAVPYLLQLAEIRILTAFWLFHRQELNQCYAYPRCFIFSVICTRVVRIIEIPTCHLVSFHHQKIIRQKCINVIHPVFPFWLCHRKRLLIPMNKNQNILCPVESFLTPHVFWTKLWRSFLILIHASSRRHGEKYLTHIKRTLFVLSFKMSSNSSGEGSVQL